jgi:hypothetical protein
MKLTKRQLTRLIKEELENVLTEEEGDDFGVAPVRSGGPGKLGHGPMTYEKPRGHLQTPDISQQAGQEKRNLRTLQYLNDIKEVLGRPTHINWQDLKQMDVIISDVKALINVYNELANQQTLPRN